MPPVSRRRKKHEESLRKVQSRNLIAGLLLVLVAVASVYLIWFLQPARAPTVHVSINRINHSGSRSIPFSNDDSKGSCDIVKKAFEEFLKCKTDDKIHDLDDQKSELKIVPSKIDPRDILVVYLNGHLTDAKSRPSALDNSSSENGPSTDDDVYWICPDSDNVENKLSDLLAPISKSDAKIKLVLLDAGRYSWSPTYPGRETNEFQSVLKKKLESNEWGLSENFWIISSHSDGEISNVSTPLKGSLFAIAIKESLKALAEAGETEIQVPALFEQIENRTTTFSQNFGDKSLQNPVLMKAGADVSSDSAREVVSSDSTTDEPLILGWNDLPEKDEKAPPAPTEYGWTEEFGPDSDSSFSQALFKAPHPAALPKESLYRVEMFLEHGHVSRNWGGPDDQKKNDYLNELKNNRREPPDPTHFDESTFLKKQQRTNDFRRAILELAVLSRFRNQFRLFDDNAWKEVAEQQNNLSFIPLTDQQLTESREIPSIERFPGHLEEFLEKHVGLMKTVEIHRKKNDPWTPMQAELLGVLAHRYLPLIQGFAANQEPSNQPAADAKKNDSSDEPARTFTLSLVPQDGTDRYDPDSVRNASDPSCGIKAVAEKGKQEFREILAAASDPDSDTSHRYRLAAKGSEFLRPRQAVVPGINWRPIEKSISISARTSGVQVPFFEPKQFRFDLNTADVNAVDLQIKQTGSELPGLSFGLDEDFGDKLKLTELDKTGQRYLKTKAFDVYFRYAVPAEKMKGKQFDFEITAIDRAKPDEKPYSFPFSIKITSDATLRIAATRVLANVSSETRLYRWGVPPGRDWEPLRLRTLANVKSPFKFKLTSETQNAEKLTARLFAIKRFPPQIDKVLLSSDRDSTDQISAFVRYLEKESNIAGVPPLERPDSFEIIGEAKIPLPKTGDVAMEFLPPPKDPEATDDNEKSNDAVVIEHGLILALYSEDENGTSRNPTWYQMLFFEPQEPANAVNNKENLLKIRPDIVSRFGPIDIDRLPESLAPSVVDEKEAARLTVVSEAAFVENRHIVHSLDLGEVLGGNGSVLPFDSQSPAMLLLEALGLPNYMTFESDGTVSSSGFRRKLTGIRIKKPLENWKVYPETWSFASNSPPDPPYEWLAGHSNTIQNIYVRIGEDVAGNDQGKGELELYLPLRKDVLAASPDDFSVFWKGGTTELQYPNERKHLISITKNGFLSWSEVRSHSIPISRISNRRIQVRRESDDQILGQWQFITSSPKIGPGLTASQRTFEQTPIQVSSTLIKLDVRQIIPPIRTSAIQLSLNGGEPLPAKKLEKFLEQDDRVRERGLYEFSFADLRTAFGKKMHDPLEPNTVITAEVIDFFGEPCTEQLRLTITEKKKEKPKPKAVTLEISFAGTDDTPVDLMEFLSVQLNGSSISLTRPSAFNGSTLKVLADVDTPSLKISGLFPGTYSIQVTADVRPPGEAQFISSSTKEVKVVVTEQEAKATLSFK